MNLQKEVNKIASQIFQLDTSQANGNKMIHADVSNSQKQEMNKEHAHNLQSEIINIEGEFSNRQSDKAMHQEVASQNVQNIGNIGGNILQPDVSNILHKDNSQTLADLFSSNQNSKDGHSIHSNVNGTFQEGYLNVHEQSQQLGGKSEMEAFNSIMPTVINSLESLFGTQIPVTLDAHPPTNTSPPSPTKHMEGTDQAQALTGFNSVVSVTLFVVLRSCLYTSLYNAIFFKNLTHKFNLGYWIILKLE